MKKIIATSLLLSLVAGCAQATSYVTIGLHAEGTNQVLTLQSRPVTSVRLQEVLGKLGTISPNQMILVQVESNVPANHLCSILGSIQKAGLTNVVILPAGAPIIRAQLLSETNQFFHFPEPEQIEWDPDKMELLPEPITEVEQPPERDK